MKALLFMLVKEFEFELAVPVEEFDDSLQYVKFRLKFGICVILTVFV